MVGTPGVLTTAAWKGPGALDFATGPGPGDDGFRAIVDSLPDAVFITRDGEILYANPAAAAAMGVRSPAGLLGSDIGALIPAEALAALRSSRREDSRSLAPVVEHGAGGRIIQTRMVTIPFAGGPAVLSISRDITAIRQHEATTARLAAIVESSNDAIIGCDIEGAIVSWNPGAERLLGWTAAEAIGRDQSLVIPSEDRVNSQDRFTRILTGGGAIHEQKADRITKDGATVTVRLSAFPIHDAAGKLIGVASVAHDITAEQGAARALARAEIARREAEERLRAVVRHLPTFIGAIDADGLVTLAEGRLLSAFGLTSATFAGQSLFGFLPPDHPVCLAARRALAGEDVIDTVTVEDRVFEFLMAPMRDEGLITGAVCVGRDVTDEVRAEQARIQAQKLESLVVLAGGVAHDFNNLLHVIIGNADLASLGVAPGSDPATALGEITTAAQRAAALARQMLAYSGHGRLTADAVDVAALVSTSVAELRQMLPPAVTLSVDLSEALPAVEGDPGQLRQVIASLVTNAAEAIEPGHGSITLRSGVVAAGEQFLEGYLPAGLPSGMYVLIQVADTGGGMDDATKTRIFDPFFTTKFVGRGLGLAAVFGIVRGHGGGIHVESEPGEGSTFTVLLPLAASTGA